MEEKLPCGWVETPLESFADVNSGIGFPKSLQGKKNGQIPFYKVGDISQTFLKGEKYLSIANNYIDQAELKELKGKLFPKGTVVFAKIGEALKLNRRAILSQPSLIDNNVMGIITKHDLSNKFLYYYMRTRELSSYSAGNAVPSVRKSTILNIKIPLPPLPEQKRIVAKLDTLFASLDNTKARLEKIPQLLKNFRQAVLTQAVAGKNNYVKLNELTLKIGSGATPKGGQTAYKSEGIPLVRSMNIHFNGIKSEGLAFIDNKQAEQLRNAEIKDGDVLLNITGASIGRVCVAEESIIGGRVNQHVAIIRPNKSISSKYLNIYLSSSFIQNYIHTENYGVTRQALTKTQIQNFNIPLLKFKEQHEIVRRIESLFAKADAIEQQYKKLKEKVDALPQAILAKAFRGELVEQNPLDEPASVLLERIRAEKEKMTPQGKKTTMKRKVDVAAEPDEKYRKKER